MNRGVGEVRQPPGVVGVAVGENDVCHVLNPESEPFDLSNRRPPFLELEPCCVDGGLTDSFERVGDVLQSNPRVDERKAAVAFEQQTVASGLRAGRCVENAAVIRVMLRGRVSNNHASHVKFVSHNNLNSVSNKKSNATSANSVITVTKEISVINGIREINNGIIIRIETKNPAQQPPCL